MSIQTFGAIRDARGFSPTEKLVLYTVAAHSPNCFASYGRLAEETGLHRDTLKRTLKTLSIAGVLTIVSRQRPNGSTSSNELAVTREALVVPRPAPQDASHDRGPPGDRGSPRGCSIDDPPGIEDPPGDARSTIPASGDRGSLHPGIEDPPPEVTLMKKPSEVYLSAVPSSSEADADVQDKPAPDARGRYRAAYAAGIEAGTGKPWAYPTGRDTKYADEYLGQSIKTYAVDDQKRGLRGPALLDWMRDRTEAFVRYVETAGDDPKFWSAFDPKGFLRWLKQGAPTKPAIRRDQRRDDRPRQPGGSTDGWSKPIKAQHGEGDAASFVPEDLEDIYGSAPPDNELAGATMQQLVLDALREHPRGMLFEDIRAAVGRVLRRCDSADLMRVIDGLGNVRPNAGPRGLVYAMS